jgi:hypothetical protein
MRRRGEKRAADEAGECGVRDVRTLARGAHQSAFDSGIVGESLLRRPLSGTEGPKYGHRPTDKTATPSQSIAFSFGQLKEDVWDAQMSGRQGAGRPHIVPSPHQHRRVGVVVEPNRFPESRGSA